MEKKVYQKSGFEYSFDTWLKGETEPDHPFWKIDIKNGKYNPEYLKISKAKKNIFDWSLEAMFALGKLSFQKKIEELNQKRKEAIVNKMILDSKKKFEKHEIDDLIFQKHPKKYDGIDGEKYLSIEKAYKDFQDGILIGFSYFSNDFLIAVLNFELNEFYQEYLQNDCKDPEPIDSKTPEKGESVAVKYKLLTHFFTQNKEYNKLNVRDQERLLGYIFGCRYDTAKHVKNNASKSKPDGKYITEQSLNRLNFLIDKIKKGDFL